MATKSIATQSPASQPAVAPPETFAFVVQHTPLLHDGVLHLPGDAVELTEAQALRQGANVSPAPTPEDAKE